MAKLKNARWELFAQGMARGETKLAAYRQAGYRQDNSNCYKLSQFPMIRQRVNELIEEGAGRKALDLGKAIGELASLAFSDITQIINWTGEISSVVKEIGEDGQEVSTVITKAPARLILTDSARLDSVTRAAIAKVRQTREGITVEMHPKLPALLSLVEYLKELEALKAQVPQLAAPTGQVVDFAALNKKFMAKAAEMVPAETDA